VPAADALQMSASHILTKEPLPPTIFLFGDRDHLKVPQEAFIERARKLGQKFEVEIYKGGGHSFMMQPAFQGPSTQDVQAFLEREKILE
jgi:acetyl esterase/lipase